MKLLAYVAVALAGLVAISVWSFWLTVRPPRLAIPGTPRDHGLPFEDLRITTDDGLHLAAWLIPRATPAAPGTTAPGHAAAIVLLHGYPAEKADLLPLASSLHAEFTTLLLDFRYFGQSGGRATTLGHRERFDLVRALDALSARGFTEIGVFGYSLGGAVALLGASEDPRIRAVVAYAPFSDLRVLGRDVYRSLWLAKYPLVALMTLWSRLAFGADITRPSPVMAAERLAIPVLLVASRDDEQIPFHHAERLAKALASNPRAELLVARGGHNERADDVDRRLVEFLRTHLR
jgi:uncharacterized protein